LLSHLPLFRKDDLACGAERVREEGHVTYEHPSFEYETHHHVLSDALSQDLLTKLGPDVVLSGHTHAWCAYEHPPHSSTRSTAKEFTVPAFSWGQRPDPSYALLHIAGRDAYVSRCALPREPLVFALYGGTLVVLVLRLLWRGIAMKSRSPSHLHDQGKKLK
jgi:ethanolamine phosphate phosphodiesterase